MAIEKRAAINKRAAKSSSVDRKQVLGWVERVASFFAEHYGLPPITGRIVGWLMICDPPEQSPAEIAAAIGASRASLTTNMRLLIASGLVHRLTRAGGRTTYYRIDEDMWEQVIRRRIAAMMSFGRITQDAIDMLGRDSPQAARIRAAHDFFEWMAKRLAASPGPSPRRGGNA
jgi:DNA-binding transcriptional regulator GbsR (MarR family)